MALRKTQQGHGMRIESSRASQRLMARLPNNGIEFAAVNED